jgi:hypothetical protein
MWPFGRTGWSSSWNSTWTSHPYSDQLPPAVPKSGLTDGSAACVAIPKALMCVSQNEKTRSPGRTSVIVS